MHIALATLEYPTEPYRAGGMCWAFSKIARGLKDIGHQITVVVPADKDETITDEFGIAVQRYRVRKHLPERIEKALSWRLPVSADYYNHARSLYQALDAIDRNDGIELVLAAASPVSFFAAGSRRWPYVVRISSYRLLIVISNFFPATRGFLFEDWMNVRSCTWADARFAPSNMLASIFEKLRCGKTRVVHTPVNGAVVSAIRDEPAPDGRFPGRFILFYGSLQGTKGVHHLADALPAILKEHPDLHAVFIGRNLTAPEFGSMHAYIEGALSSYTERVHLLGVMEQAAALDYVARAEWVVFPSVMDNLPNTLIESMCLSRPVLVTQNSGTDELVEDGYDGLVVDSNSKYALQAGLAKALSLGEKERSRMGAAAREKVLKVCDPQKSADDLNELLVTVLQNHSKAASWCLPTVARLSILRLQWALLTARYCLRGAPGRAVRRLKELAAYYLPGCKLVIRP